MFNSPGMVWIVPWEDKGGVQGHDLYSNEGGGNDAEPTLTFENGPNQTWDYRQPGIHFLSSAT